MKVIEIKNAGTTKIVDPCNIGTNVKQAEGMAEEYLVDDFIFSMEDGEALYQSQLKVVSGSEIKVRVYDQETGKEYFSGDMTTEGTGYSEEKGFYTFRAVHFTKAVVEIGRAHV